MPERFSDLAGAACWAARSGGLTTVVTEDLGVEVAAFVAAVGLPLFDRRLQLADRLTAAEDVLERVVERLVQRGHLGRLLHPDPVEQILLADLRRRVLPGTHRLHVPRVFALGDRGRTAPQEDVRLRDLLLTECGELRSAG